MAFNGAADFSSGACALTVVSDRNISAINQPGNEFIYKDFVAPDYFSRIAVVWLDASGLIRVTEAISVSSGGAKLFREQIASIVARLN
jgi:hypothetical protein